MPVSTVTSSTLAPAACTSPSTAGRTRWAGVGRPQSSTITATFFPRRSWSRSGGAPMGWRSPRSITCSQDWVAGV